MDLKGKTIKMNLEEYVRLRQQSTELELLQNGGVDNWEGYGDSLNPDDNDFGDMMDDIEDKVKEEWRQQQEEFDNVQDDNN